MEKLKIVLYLVLAVLQVVLFISRYYGKWCDFYRLLLQLLFNFKPEVPIRRLDELQLWNSFSYYPAVTSWDTLESQSGKYIGRDKNMGSCLLLTLHTRT